MIDGYPSLEVYFKEYSFKYKEYIIKIDRSNIFYLNIINEKIPFIYSGEQIIKIEEDKDIYELKFIMKVYNNELLYLYSNDAYIPFSKCSKNENETELICNIEKEYVKEVLQNNNQEFAVYCHHNTFHRYKIELIDKIIIIDELYQKQDIYLRIKKILQQFINTNNYITYETNVTSISNLVSSKFQVQRNNKDYITCYFKRSGDDPLLFLCKWKYTDEKNTLGEIKNEIILNNISMKYNFRIQPSNNNENFQTKNPGINAYFVYPNLLNYTLNDTSTITYVSDNPQGISGIYFIKSKFFFCNNIQNQLISICNINRDMFRNQKNKYYHTYQEKYYTTDDIIYEYSAIKVIIPNDRAYLEINEYQAHTGTKKNFYLNTDYFDEENMINSFDVAEKTLFNSYVTNSHNSYNVTCRL